MNNNFISNLLRFLILILIQVGLFKNMGYYNLAIPLPYILFILLLPIGISNFSLFVIALITGLTVDAFYDSIGVHAAACVMLAWFRIFFHRITLDIDAQESSSTPSWGNMGFKWFGTYVVFSTLIHHTVLFLVEVFSFRNFAYTLFGAILSSIFTIILIFIISVITYRRKSRLAN
ncbi:rod shape-determining protein MreD [Sphingobacterium sp. SGG-5]|uniref:rod shape-determining protein MreD n=1 Tax=Sphingobacterium sp. SGG-5 TaxID=2710881 RepID=UPI0013EA5788|nr:rod shape-determining protein MreD [Sphingobacterium sp. SGG-5]NGM61367.1 rod shape-determining protein MreD [Sphingobacterium sp. SGG-5]